MVSTTGIIVLIYILEYIRTACVLWVYYLFILDTSVSYRLVSPFICIVHVIKSCLMALYK